MLNSAVRTEGAARGHSATSHVLGAKRKEREDPAEPTAAAVGGLTVSGREAAKEAESSTFYHIYYSLRVIYFLHSMIFV